MLSNTAMYSIAGAILVIGVAMTAYVLVQKRKADYTATKRDLYIEVGGIVLAAGALAMAGYTYVLSNKTASPVSRLSSLSNPKSATPL